MERRPSYRHAQVGLLGFALMMIFAIGWLAVATGMMIAAKRSAFMLVPGIVTMIFAFAFRALTVEINGERVSVSFCGGLIRRRIALADIRQAQAVRNTWLHGWGIKMIKGGWMFNISGLDAVELDLANGSKFRIGTDQPKRLVAALRSAANLPES